MAEPIAVRLNNELHAKIQWSSVGKQLSASFSSSLSALFELYRNQII